MLSSCEIKDNSKWLRGNKKLNQEAECQQDQLGVKENADSLVWYVGNRNNSPDLHALSNHGRLLIPDGILFSVEKASTMDTGIWHSGLRDRSGLDEKKLPAEEMFSTAHT